MPKGKTTKYRSSKTGEYVSKEYANKHPSTTVKETDKAKRKKKKSK